MYKWFRKAIAVVLAGTLVMTCAPLEALAADTGTDGGAAATVTRTTALLAEGTDWTLDLNDTLKIESNAGMINWRSHKSLNWDYSTKLKDHVRNVEIGMQVTYIIENAFGGCENLASVTIPNSIKTIGKQAFQYCIALTSVVIPNGVESIEYAAFDNCTNLKSVTFPDSLTTIGYGAFNNCNGLTSVTIPDSVTSIQCPFIGCDNLQNINVNSGNNSYTSIDGILFTKDLMELVQYPTGKEKTSYTIPSSVTSIADYAFYMCNNLTSLTIPDSVTTIGDRAFDNCDNLTVYCDANSYAETYCKENNIPYKPLSEYPSEGLLLVTNTLTLEKGTTGKLSVFGTGPKTWTSADPNIATVSADEGGNSATVTAVSEGETTITVTCGAESATAKIIVTSSSTGDEEGEKTSFVLNPANLTLEEESQGVVIPENVPDTQMVYWSSSDETVVSLDYDTTFGEKNCTLKANSVGTATITATYGNYSATCSVTVVKPFDRWGIGNPTGSYPISVDEVANKYKEASGQELTPTERNRVQKEINRSNKKDTDAALCHGLSLTTMLTHTGDLRQPWLWGSSDTIVPDSLLTVTKMTPELNKQLAYYQLSQQFNVAKDAETAYTRAAKKDKMKVYNDLKDMLSSGNGFEKPVMIGFEYFENEKKASHAVLAYEFQTGSWNIDVEVHPGETKKEYFDARVRYYEPNSPTESYVPPKTQDDSRYYLYLNSNTGDWAFDCGKYEASDNYNYLSTANSFYSSNIKITTPGYGFFKAKIEIVSNDPSDFIPLEDNISNDIVNILTVSNVSSLYNIETSPFSVKSGSEEWNWTDIAKEENNIVTLVNSRDAVNSEEEGTPINIVFPTTSQNYTVQLNDNSIHEFTMDYTNMLLSAEVDQTNKGEITFSQDGSVSLNGNDGSYELSSTLNDAPLDLFTVTVTGEKATDVQLTPTDDGYIMDGDNLTDITISGNDADQTKTLPLNTDKKSVKVTENNDDELVVSVDNDNDGTYETPIAVSKTVKSISLNKTSLSMHVGDTASLTATCDPKDATVQWTSSDTSIATVSNGTVKALKPGTATITATAGDKSATCQVTVTEDSGKPTPPSGGGGTTSPARPLESISLNTMSAQLAPNGTVQLEVSYTPSNTTSSKSVTWTSSDEKIATVDKNGKVTAVSKAGGTATITAKVGDKTATCNIAVNPFTVKITDLDGKTTTCAADGSTVIQIPQSAAYTFNIASGATIDSFSYNAGNGKVGGTNTIAKWNVTSGTYQAYAAGKVGEKTGMYVNGIKLFTLEVTARPFTSDTTLTTPVQVGHPYTFRITLDDPKADFTFLTANGKALSTSYQKDSYPDKNGDYYCTITAHEAVGDVGVYVKVAGKTYKVFAARCIKG